MAEITNATVEKVLEKGIKPGVGPCYRITVRGEDRRTVATKVTWGAYDPTLCELIAQYNIGQANVLGSVEFYNVPVEVDVTPDEVAEQMTTLRAIEIIESDPDATAREELEAWAHMISTGLCWQLQGFYGRTAHSLIESGLISVDGEIDWSVVENEPVD